MRLFRFVISELFNNKRFCLLFVLNLSFGLTGFIALDGFKSSLDRTIKGRSKAVLGGDFGISTRRPITEKEREGVTESIQVEYDKTEMIEMFSMVADGQRRSRLVQLKAIEENYPFYGEIVLENSGSVDEKAHTKIKTEKKVWVYPELLRQLSVKVGDLLFIGDSKFEIDDVVKEDAASGISTNMAPRIYLNKVHLKETGLLRKGSIAWHSAIYKIPGQSSQQLDVIRDKTFALLDSPEIRVYTHENVSQQMTTLISRLNDFLGLSSLVALFLAAVGSTFLFRSYFNQRIKQVATLLCLGATRPLAFGYYFAQIFILGLVSSLVAILLSLFIVPGLGGITKDLLPFEIQFGIDPTTILVGLLMGAIGSLLICLPILASLKDIRPSLLLVHDRRQNNPFTWLGVIALIPGIGLFWFLSIWLSHSYQVGSLFSALFLASTIILGGSSQLFFAQLGRKGRRGPLAFRWALRDLARNRISTMVGFVAIGLGSLLLNVVPQVQRSLEVELERPEQSKLPSLFMFDIQEEQLDDFEKVLKQQGVTIDFISPTIRARLVKVNGEEFDKGKGLSKNFTREEEREMRFRNRGFNLSYRDKLSEAESIVEGKDFSGIYTESSENLPEISVEKRFAARLGLKVGDELEFEIESVPVKGKVINLRSVKWTSFRPNFFVQFQPGVLEMAPKAYIATTPNLPLEQKHQLQDRLVESLPNISMVDVSRIVKRISGIMEQMSWALIFMSVLCLFAGFIVIYSIANHQASVRGWEVGLLKSLGASFSDIRGQFLWQFSLLTFFSLTVGSVLSLVVSYILSSFLFESVWAFDWKTPLLSVVGGVIITWLVTLWAIQSALEKKTRDLFSD